jgi:SAM-dependent methyltransferase
VTAGQTEEGIRAYPLIATAWGRLATYLGTDFDPELTDGARCCDAVDAEFARYGEQFYERSEGYLYELTRFHYSGFKDRFFGVVRQAASRLGLQRLADVGCGVGLDAQALVGLGYGVSLFDLDCPSRRYAAWRLARDGFSDVSVRGLSELGTDRFDLAYAVDVLEHVPDPQRFIAGVFAAANYVCVNIFEHDPSPWDGRDMHYPLDHWSVLPEFTRHGILTQVEISAGTVTTLWQSRNR